MSRLCGYCGGAADSILSVYSQLHRSGFNLEFGAFFKSICTMVADLSQRKGEISGCFKNSTSIVLQQCHDKASFQRKGSGIISTFLCNFQRVEGAL